MEEETPSGGLQLQLFRDYLPEKPYCTDRLGGGLAIAPAIKAIKRRYIQPNSPWDLRWLVYDIDYPVAIWYWSIWGPTPNIVVINPENNHAHFLYSLEVPVYTQREAHGAPLRYAASVDVALTLKLEADPGYAGLICKNPLHKHWEVHVMQEVSYTLEWLAGWLDLEPYRDKRKHLPPIGLGRNCTLFDVTRRWAYRHIRTHQWQPGAFTEAVTDYASCYNQREFEHPLSWSEVKATGKSVAGWTYRRMSPQGFKAWGDGRREKSIITRQTKSQERAIEIKAFKAVHPDMSNRMVAQVFDCDEKTIRNVLKS